jgi:hypothetical protein
MAFCGPNHHAGGSPSGEIRANASKQSHHGEAVFVHEFETGASAEAAVAPDPSATAKVSQVATQKCSACASCCSVGAILTTVQGIPATDPAPTVFNTIVPTVDLFAAGGPDRPPRSILA